MSNLVDEVENKFKFSGQPSQLESYECFHDPSRERGDFIKGQEVFELRRKGAEQNERQERTDEKVSIWYYFYRPYNYGKNIASEQIAWIEERNKFIELKSLGSSKNKTYFHISLIFMLISLLGLLNYSLSLALMILPGIISFNFFYEYSIAEEEKRGLERENEILDQEIDYLINQKAIIDKEIRRLRKGPIMELFWRNIKSKEQGYLNTFSNPERNTLERNAVNFYSSLEEEVGWDADNRPSFPIVPSWAMLQSSVSQGGLFSSQHSGLKVSARRIEERVATWRGYEGGEPIFRLWYIQFIFFFDKHLSIISFYYDFIEDRIYSQNVEVFQYSHITNYSFVDEDISFMKKGKMAKRFPKKFKKNIFGNEVKTISLSSASGVSCRSVLPDADVNKGLNQWLENLIREQDTAAGEQQDPVMEDAMLAFSSDLKEERLTTEIANVKHKGLMESLALLAFKEISLRVAEFSLSENTEWSLKRRLDRKINRSSFDTS